MRIFIQFFPKHLLIIDVFLLHPRVDTHVNWPFLYGCKCNVGVTEM